MASVGRKAGQKHLTPLLRFLQAFGHGEVAKSQKDRFAEAAGTTYVYLHQLATQPAPNPRLKLALALVAESERLAGGLMTSPLSPADLLIGSQGEQLPRPRRQRVPPEQAVAVKSDGLTDSNAAEPSALRTEQGAGQCDV